MIARDAGRPPVLFLHGAGGGGWEWNLWRTRFEAAGHPCAAPDLQPVPAGIGATTLEDYRTQALLAARAMAVPPVVVGASLGGLLALSVAAAQACAALVLVNPLPPAPEAALLPPTPPEPAVVRWRSLGRFESTARAMRNADAAARLYAWRRWRDESGVVLDHARAGLALASPQCPLLVIASAADREVPAAVSVALAARLGAQRLDLPGAHLDPLLGSAAHEAAWRALGWLNCTL